MTRRAVPVVVSVLIVVLAGCTGPLAAQQSDPNSHDHDLPLKQTPGRPATLNNTSVLDYVTQYEHVRAYNEAVIHGSSVGNVANVSVSVFAIPLAQTDHGYYIEVKSWTSAMLIQDGQQVSSDPGLTTPSEIYYVSQNTTSRVEISPAPFAPDNYVLTAANFDHRSHAITISNKTNRSVKTQLSPTMKLVKGEGAIIGNWTGPTKSQQIVVTVNSTSHLAQTDFLTGPIPGVREQWQQIGTLLIISPDGTVTLTPYYQRPVFGKQNTTA